MLSATHYFHTRESRATQAPVSSCVIPKRKVIVSSRLACEGSNLHTRQRLRPSNYDSKIMTIIFEYMPTYIESFLQNAAYIFNFVCSCSRSAVGLHLGFLVGGNRARKVDAGLRGEGGAICRARISRVQAQNSLRAGLHLRLHADIGGAFLVLLDILWPSWMSPSNLNRCRPRRIARIMW